jgi:hypothetical protein
MIEESSTVSVLSRNLAALFDAMTACFRAALAVISLVAAVDVVVLSVLLVRCTTFLPNAAKPQPKKMSKNGVLPSKWCCQDTHPEGERHEDAFAFRRQVYQPARRCALLF